VLFSKCPSIRGCLVHDPALFQIFPALFGLPEHKQISIPAQIEIRIEGQITDFMEIQACMVMDQTLPLGQASVV
jgi:hypothetical protein